MKRLFLLVLAALIPFHSSLAVPASEKEGSDNLDEELETSAAGFDWKVWYTTDTNFLSTTPDDYMSEGNAEDLPGCIDDLASRQIGDLGFGGYYIHSDPTFKVYCNDLVYWYGSKSTTYGVYNSYRIALSSSNLRSIYGDTPEKLSATLAHEMFHGIQFKYFYDSGYNLSDTEADIMFADWLIEGTAACMDDRWQSARDGATDGLSHHARARSYLNDTYLSLYDRSYDTALFWSYCCEQLDSNYVEPERGYRFIRTLFQKIRDELADSNVSTTDSINAAIRDHSDGQTMEDLFLDFTICNYLREFDASLLPDAGRYYYIDEQPSYDGGAGAYAGTVSRLGVSFPGSGSDTTWAYSPRYYRSTDVSAYLCQAVGFRFTSDEELGGAVIAMNSNSQPFLVVKGTGKDWARSMIVSTNNPVKTIIATVAGFEDGGDFNYWFDAGPITNTIVEPTSIHQTFPGTSNQPGSFIVRLLVEGPAGLTPDGAMPRSIEGLSREDFYVKVGTNYATVKNACYADAEYWLWVSAPTQPSNGVYDLAVSLCNDAQHFTVSPDSVYYGDFQVNHVVVLDHSGSMDYPAGDTKLEAAKDAAQLYIAAVSDDDRIGFVKFSGNGTEPNEDGQAIPTNKLLPANLISRSLYILGIEGITPALNTSLGDGLWTGQGLLSSAPPTNRIPINTLLLLSDGLENEARYWNRTNGVAVGVTLRDYISSTNTVISTVALGTDADQGLLQDISDATAGHYGFVEVTTSAVGTLTFPNSLAESFMDGLVHASGLERLDFDYGTILANSDVTSTTAVQELNVDDGLFYFNWDKAGAITNLLLYGPASNLIDDTCAIVYTGATFKTYHMTNLLTPGSYRAVLQAGNDPQYTAGLLGRPSNLVHVVLALSRILADNQQDLDADAILREYYQQGVPVQIVAMVSDRNGPVTGAVAHLSVTLPTGAPACGPLFLYDDGKHADGRKNDGVYAAAFTQTRFASTTGNDKDTNAAAILPPQRGTYRVGVTVTGQSNSGDGFTRQENAAFHVYQRLNWDADGDTMANTWEEYHGTPLGLVAGADPDDDGLNNEAEYLNGTDPFNADSDDGGETDGSEVLAGRCPHTPDDDLMRQPDDSGIISRMGDIDSRVLQTNANLIHFPVRPAYTQIIVQRSTNSTGPFVTFTNRNLLLDDTPYLYDTGLTSGVRYFYRVRAENAAGSKSQWSRIFSGVPRTDPIPPGGSVIINNAAPRTDSTNVLLRLLAPSDVVLFRVSTLPITGSGPTIPYTNRVPYAMSIPPAIAATVSVFVTFIDAAGNESDEMSDEIYYDPSTFGTLDDDGDGIPDNLEVMVFGTDPFQFDTDGDGLSDSNEMAVTHSSPLVPDSDSDGLNDGAELAIGTSPLDPDDDHDGLLDGWEVTYGFDPLGVHSYPVTVGNSSGLAFFIGGIARKPLTFTRNKTYRFLLDGTTTLGHPFFFSTDAGGGGGGGYPGEYTNGVTGSRATSGIVTINVSTSTPSPLYYYCGIHAGMGAMITIADGEATQDSDGDGMNNFAEYVAGSDPLEIRSTFQITGTGRNGPDAFLEFPGIRRRVYTFWLATNLMEAPVQWTPLQVVTAETATARYTVSATGLTHSLYYRVECQPP